MAFKDVAITTEWLNQSLAQGIENQIVHCQIDDIGDGNGFGGKTLRANLTWEQPADLASVIIKLPVEDPTSLASLMISGVLMREVRFYQEIAPHLDLDIPKIYYTEIDDHDFVIIMEDLGEVKQRMLKPLDTEELETAVRSIAKLHAAFWNSPALEADWLSPVADGDDESRQDNFRSMNHALELLAESPEDTSYVEACIHRLIDLLPKAPKVTPLPNPITLAHGDFHGNNIHIHEDQVTIFDWQLVAKGTPAMDVANLIASSSEPTEYQKIAEPLLKTYHEALLAEGITDYPLSKLQQGYADAMFFTFLKFVVVVGTISYDAEGGEALQADILPKLDFMARNADAEGYIKKLPFLFVIIRIINFFNRIGSWFQSSRKNL